MVMPCRQSPPSPSFRERLSVRRRWLKGFGPMSQDDVSSRLTDAALPKTIQPPRAAAGSFGQGVRPRDNSVFLAVGVSRPVACRVPGFAGRSVLRAARSAAAAAPAATGGARAGRASDDAVRPGAASRGKSGLAWRCGGTSPTRSGDAPASRGGRPNARGRRLVGHGSHLGGAILSSAGLGNVRTTELSAGECLRDPAPGSWKAA